MAYSNRGLAYYYLGNYAEAISNYKIEYELTKNVDVLFKIGLTYNAFNKPDSALIEFNKCISLNSSNAEAYHEAAKIYDMKGNKDKALEFFNMAVQINPNNEKLYYDRALEKISINDFQGALSDCSTALKINPQFAEANMLMKNVETRLKE
jgi:tetratricopeptide (TPR) repeat protein